MTAQASGWSVFGIRHHGPGSAKSLLRALNELQPDIILVEGPADAADVLSMVAHQDMEPPVAILVYVPDDPKLAACYPYAVFSPEWQAIRYALTNNIPVRFMDLPVANQLAIAQKEESMEKAEPTPPTPNPQPPSPEMDPLAYLAEAAGYSDSERWWEHMVEHRQDGTDLFAAIAEAMSELRGAVPPSPDKMEAQREAYMRQTIRQAQGEGFQKIAVVCGAWHAPALMDLPSASKDAALLKGLPKVKVTATWVPWTYGRLSYFSGYGAGIESPGWYHHLWTAGDQVAVRWMARVAQLFREEDLDASSAHVIEAVRLAESLAALRDRPLPGLPEMNEAVQTVFCFGSDTPMRLIAEKLIIGEKLGRVPEDTPTVPLQQDLSREQKRLRMEVSADQKTYDLDLRKPTDLERSHLLHRLDILGVPWGVQDYGVSQKGTFHELWQVQWQPDFAVAIIEAARWGNTVYNAASSLARNSADKAADLPELTSLLDKVMLADVQDAVQYLMARLQNEAAVTSDVIRLMDALPPLANVLRYGDVRQTDRAMVEPVIQGLVSRICIGLPGACSSLNDEAAAEMFSRILSTHDAISLIQNEDHLADWFGVMQHMVDQQGLHGLISGRCCRIILDAGKVNINEAARRMGLAISLANEPQNAAAWVEGFLQGSGLVLLHDNTLWQVLDQWVSGLSPDIFNALLPLLRRTFSTFEAPERRQMGELVKRGFGSTRTSAEESGAFDTKRAEAVLPIVAQLLGITIDAIEVS